MNIVNLMNFTAFITCLYPFSAFISLCKTTFEAIIKGVDNIFNSTWQ